MRTYIPRSAPSGRARDDQRQRVYDAEGALPDGKPLPTVADMQAYADRLLNSAWARRRWPVRTIKVEDGAGHRSAMAKRGLDGPQVEMPKWARNERVILHEIAHHLTGYSVAAHGPEFTRIYLELVEHALGADVGAKLELSYANHGVRIGPPLKLRATPAPARVVERTRLYKVEVKRRGKPTTIHEVLEYDVADALSSVLRGHYKSTDREQITGIRAWVGRPAKAATKKARKA